MSAAPISAAEPDVPAPVRAALERAGWPVEAWLWEQALAAGLAALAEGDPAAARSGFAEAQALAERALPADDLRRITAAANLAILDGDRPVLVALAGQWAAGEAWVAALRPRRRAGSSTFHLRLEARHPGGYNELHAARLRRLWEDGRSRLARAGDCPVDAALAGAALQRRRSASDVGFVDEWKLRTAAGLLLG